MNTKLREQIRMQVRIINDLHIISKEIKRIRQCIRELDRVIPNTCTVELKDLIDSVTNAENKAHKITSVELVQERIGDEAYYQLRCVDYLIRMTYNVMKNINRELKKIVKPTLDWFDSRTRRDLVYLEDLWRSTNNGLTFFNVRNGYTYVYGLPRVDVNNIEDYGQIS